MNKNKKKYSVHEDFMKLCDIAEVMTANGDKMNHSTVRNHLNKGLEKIAFSMLIHQGFTEEYAQEHYKKLARSPDFQIGLKEMMENMDI